jgi:hypothetical protein
MLNTCDVQTTVMPSKRALLSDEDRQRIKDIQCLYEKRIELGMILFVDEKRHLLPSITSRVES